MSIGADFTTSTAAAAPITDRCSGAHVATGTDFIASTAAAATITDRCSDFVASADATASAATTSRCRHEFTALVSNQRTTLGAAAWSIAIISRVAATRRLHRLAGHPGEW